jgi:uracil DNA glycosylase
VNKIRAIIIGQDPYSKTYCCPKNGIDVPQAQGLSFSVDAKMKIPSSLKNIFKNMHSFGVIDDIPKSGDLTYLAEQGILLINASLTTRENKANAHYKMWKDFMEMLLKELLINISKNTTKSKSSLDEFNEYMVNGKMPVKDTKVTILCFGKFAINMITKILKTKVAGIQLSEVVNTTVSTHPSGLSRNIEIKENSIMKWLFSEADHFGFLKEKYGIEFDQKKYYEGKTKLSRSKNTNNSKSSSDTTMQKTI